jgi:hypothetical protein
VNGKKTGLWRVAVAAIWLLALAATSAWADNMPCSVPEGLAFTGFSLPESRVQFESGKRLVVLVIGGASIGGTAAGGRGFSMPMRLEARLRTDLPGHDIAVTTRAIDGGNTRVAADQMAAAIHDAGARLVIWETGSSAAAAGDDLEMFGTNLEFGINAARAAKADIILMDLQYAPSIARVMNQTPYCDAIRGAAQMADAPMLRRSELMHAWSDSGDLDFDAASSAERLKVARKLYDCLAAMLAIGIAGALH